MSQAELERQEDLAFAGLSLADTVQVAPDSISFADLALALLGNGDRSLNLLSSGMTDSGKLREGFERLVAMIAIAQVPAQVAASSGRLAMRNFPGGSIQLIPAWAYGQVYVRIVIDTSLPPPQSLFLDLRLEKVARKALPQVAEGEYLLVCDRSNEEDLLFLQLLEDPRTRGAFLQ